MYVSCDTKRDATLKVVCIKKSFSLGSHLRGHVGRKKGSPFIVSTVWFPVRVRFPMQVACH